MLPTTPKPKTCHCGREFVPQRMGQRVCGPVCALRVIRSEAKAERARTKQRREAIKTIPQLTREAQTEFNRFIRERDRAAGHSCVSCGRPLDWTGNQVDAGHYRSTGAAPWLRFNEANCHAQCKQCNRHGAGRAVDYRLQMPARIGMRALEALEADSGAGHKWTREVLVATKAMYRRRWMELRKGRES